jgi:hypothetical protein
MKVLSDFIFPFSIIEGLEVKMDAIGKNCSQQFLRKSK